MHSEILQQLIEILEKTVSSDRNELERVKKHLEHAALTNFGTFIKMLSEVLAFTGNSQVARMAAGLQLKNHLTSKDPSLQLQYQERWFSLPDDIRNYVKKNILTALGTEVTRPSSAAQCIAYVAVAELPTGQWDDLIITLVEKVVSGNSTELTREAALETIGYICQDIKPEILFEQSNKILTAIIHGMRSSEPSNHVRFAATMALNNSLEFTKANFDNESERNFIMGVVCEATQSSDTRISVAALQCLVRILTLYYQFMEPYMAQALFPITLEAMKSDIEEVALQGIEFWSTVSDEEIDLAIEESEAAETGFPPVRTSRHYARGALQFLAPVLMHKLTKQEDSDEWNPSKAASVCLILLSNCCEDDILPHVLPFVEENIKSDNWRLRDAAVMAYGSVLSGLQQETLKPLIEQALPKLIELMYDTTVNVRDTTSWVFGKICETLPEPIISGAYFKPFLECMINGLTAEPRVAVNICWVFSNLAEAAYEAAKIQYNTSEPKTYGMSDYFNFIVERLLQNTDRPDSSHHNLKPSAYEALAEVIKHSPEDCYTTVQQTTVVILNRLQNVQQLEKHISGQNERSQYNEIQSLLFSTLHSLLKRFTVEDASKISDAVMQCIFLFFGSSSGKEGGIQEDALMTVSSLVDCLQEGFFVYMDAFKGYLYMSLKNHQDYQVCDTAIGLISDLFRALKKKMLPYCDEIMTLLLENLQDPTIHQAVKPQIFSAFGDIAIAIGGHFQKYLDVVMKVLFQASTVPMDRSDPDMVSHLDKLRESVLESYTGIIQGFKGTCDEPISEINLLKPYAEDIISFIMAVSVDPNITESQMSITIGLIGDLCAFGIQILPMLEHAKITAVLSSGRKSTNDKIKHNSVWASKEIRKLKNANTQTQIVTSW